MRRVRRGRRRSRGKHEVQSGSGGAPARQCQHVAALVGNQHGVLPLRRQTVILRDAGLSVAESRGWGGSGRDHGLDRENHSRLQKQAGAGLSVMQHLGSHETCGDP